MAVASASPPSSNSGAVDLTTLVAAIQNAVQAQNLIATNLSAVNTTVGADATSSLVSTLALTNTAISTLNATAVLANTALATLNTTALATNTELGVINATLAAAFPVPTVASQAWTPGGIANDASATISFAVTGVTLGQFVKASLAESLLGCDLTGYVAAANVVAAVINNNTGATVTFAATTVKVSVAST